LESAIATAQAAEEVAQTALAKSETALTTAQTAKEAAGTALTKSEEALTKAQTAITLTPTMLASELGPPKPICVLGGGVALRHQTSEGFDTILYHAVAGMEVYRSYGDFRQTWKDNGRWDQPGTVRLALIETEDNSAEWELFYIDSMADGSERPWTAWNEYSLVRVEGGETDGEFGLIYAEGPRKEVVASTPFAGGDDTIIEVSLIDLEDEGAVLDRSGRLLLADDSSEETKYILIIFEDLMPSGGDQSTSWCSRVCQGGLFCSWLCG
jgi:hypothetical protein